MSLLDEYTEDYVIVNKLVVSDGYGGQTTVWKDGATIKGALALASQSEVTVAGARGEKVTHTMLIDKSIILDYHTVLRRVTDGRVFRTTSTGTEDKTPKSSSLNKRKVTCEEWEIPAEE